MKNLSGLVLLCALLPASSILFGQDLAPFPEGDVGLNYDAVRIDLLGDCSMDVEIDGVLDDAVWALAPFQPMNEYWKGGRTPCFADPELEGCVDEENFFPEMAAVATEDFLYIAYRIIDDIRSIDSGKGGCASHHDDSMEIYIDWRNDKAEGYEEDDMQLQFWSGDIPGPGEEVSEETITNYEVGWLNAGGCIGNENVNNHPEAVEDFVHRAWATDIKDELGIPIGWQAEVQMALKADANGKIWAIEPEDGTSIGIDFHVEDDDVGGNQGGGDDSAHIWSLNDPDSQAWRTPSVFGTLTFRVLPPDACVVDAGVGPFTRGDVNGDTKVDVADSVYLLNALFSGGDAAPCQAASDVNGDGGANIADATYGLNFLFGGGERPPAPYPDCAASDTPADVELGCETSVCP